MNEQLLEFKLEGKELELEKYNIYYMVEGLNFSQKIIEQAYLTLINRTNITDSDRENIKIYATNIREGSLVTDIVIFIKDASISLLPIYASANANEIWDLAKYSFDYLKAVFEANERGDKIVYNITDSPGVIIAPDNKGTIISANRDVVENANRTFNYLKSFTNKLDEQKGLSGFNLHDKDYENKSIEVTSAEKDIFKNEPFLEHQEVRFKGIYTNAGISTYGGKIEVTDPLESGLINRFYNFDFIEKSNEQLFREGYVREREYIAFKKMKFNLETLKNEVVGLRIITVI